MICPSPKFRSLPRRHRSIVAIAGLCVAIAWPSVTLEDGSIASPGALGRCADAVAEAISESLSDGQVREIARQVTVRIFSDGGAGSGAIVDRDGDTYTVLTNDHVLDNEENPAYAVMTADGERYDAERLETLDFGDLDVAVVQFRSDRPYPVVEWGDTTAISVGDRVYASGFPNWYFSDDSLTSTRDWGTKAYRLTTGEIGMYSARSLERGYQLGYTNDIQNGMSGGPVLDASGRLIAINGRLKYPLLGIDVFKFEDGTQPSVELFKQMESLSWAIPSCRIRERF
ncbi:S1 family peptidase [Oxynema aestuarii]|uniref:S1 family peptidase n=1 Tax=Oxynema aestuarii TaxID=2874213 RepID=UPI001B313A63|nr:serine protease [Oxynema aestuarii]